MKYIILVLWFTFCLGLSLIPETIMYLVYHAIHPASELTRVIVLCAFWLVGSGVCVGFAALGIYLGLWGIVGASSRKQLL
jgi:hypothetical protein